MRMACKNTRNYIFSLPREKCWENWIRKNELIFLLQRTKRNRIQQNFHSFTITDNISENTRKLRRKTHLKPIEKDEIENCFFAARRNNTAQWEKDESCTSKKWQKTRQIFWDKSFFNCLNLDSSILRSSVEAEQYQKNIYSREANTLNKQTRVAVN